MAVDFSQFTQSSSIPTSAYFVGYEKNESGGERKWTLSTIANSVSGIIDDELSNKLNILYSDLYNPPPIQSGMLKAFVNFNSNASSASLFYLTPGTYTWTAPSGISQISARVVGGGGGGGGAGSRNNGGGGGGGGANILNSALSVTAGSSYSIIVGSGGSGGNRYTNGSNGGQSIFGTLITAGGGFAGGGGSGTGSTPTGGAAGGSGGTGGQNGTSSTAGIGGNSYSSGGGVPGVNAAANSGGGGGGGQYTAGKETGGKGGSGRVELSYTLAGSVNIRDSFNILTVTRVSQGIFDITFQPNTFSNTNYIFVGTGRESNDIGAPMSISPLSTYSKTINTIRIATKEGSDSFTDSSEICLAFFSSEI